MISLVVVHGGMVLAKVRRMVLACVVGVSLLRGAAIAKPIDQSHAEQLLDTKRLVGIWACRGTNDGKPVSAAMRWYHLEDYSLWMTLHPEPAAGHQTYVEQWTWEDLSDAAGYRDWRTAPDAASFDQASYTSTSAGFTRGKMVWIRHAAQSTMSRTFTLLGKDHLSFYESYGDPASPHVVYDLDCKRTLAGDPPPK